MRGLQINTATIPRRKTMVQTSPAMIRQYAVGARGPDLSTI